MPEGPFKAIGEYAVVLGLHHDVLANIKVVVVGEQ
jgi:large subunit ribosomal protein L9